MVAEKYGEQACGFWTNCPIIAQCLWSHTC